MKLRKEGDKKNSYSRAERIKSLKMFGVYFIAAIAITATITSGYQIVNFYAQTSQEQDEYNDLLNELDNAPATDTPAQNAGNNAVSSESLFEEGEPMTAQPTQTPTPASENDGVQALGMLTPITDDSYDPGDPTVPYASLMFMPSDVPSDGGSIVLSELLDNDASQTGNPPSGSGGSSSNSNNSGTSSSGNGQQSSSAEVNPGEQVETGPDFSRYSGGMGIDFVNLYDKNSDIKGWIRIDGTKLDYPVVQTSNNDYYLNHSFSKSKSSSGCPFIDFTNTAPTDTNVIIYGHNMNSSKTMFSPLLKYYDEDYYRQHPTINFDYIEGSGVWQIFAVFMFDINNLEQFNYSQHNFGSEAEFREFIAKAKSYGTYDTGVDVAYGDHIITLSTCDRQEYGKAGRCVVMAKYVAGNLY